MNTHSRITGALGVAALTFVLAACAPAATPTTDATTEPVAAPAADSIGLGSWVVEPTLENFSACTDATVLARVVGGSADRIDVEIVEVLRGDLSARDVVTVVDSASFSGAPALALGGAGDVLLTLANPGIETGGDDDYFAWGAHLVADDGSLAPALSGEDASILGSPEAPATLAEARAVVAAVVAGEITCPIA